MMPGLQIRAVIETDLAALIELYKHLNSEDPGIDPEQATGILQNLRAYEGSAVFAGFISGKPVSSCTLIVIPNLTRGGAPYALIENVVTHADFRERGFGKAVLRRASDAAWEAGCYKVMLLTGSESPATLGFYASAGFEQNKTGFQIRRVPPRPS